VIPDLSNLSFIDAVKAISDVALMNGYHTLIMSNDEDMEKEKNT
jgi:DNA-binding LacI/PurR family transcriptional regulator